MEMKVGWRVKILDSLCSLFFFIGYFFEKKLIDEKEKEEKRMVSMLFQKGWKRLSFFSKYTGSNWSNNRDRDEKMNILFHPSVDLSPWNGAHFTHSDKGGDDSYKNFFHWIKNLPEEKKFFEP